MGRVPLVLGHGLIFQNLPRNPAAVKNLFSLYLEAVNPGLKLGEEPSMVETRR
jgi:hypothetical protein